MANNNGHGGARPGAGRPPKALRYATTAALVEEKIAAALPEITDALIEAAKQGDIGAAKYLHDRVLGRCAALDTPPTDDRRLPYTEEDAASAERLAELSRF